MRPLLILLLTSGLAGFLSSYALTPEYTSTALLGVPPVPAPEFVEPFLFASAQKSLEAARRHAFTGNRLQRMADRLGLSAAERSEIDEIVRRHADLTPDFADQGPHDPAKPSKVLGFFVCYTDSSPQRAQQMCEGLVSVLQEWYADEGQGMVQSTGKFLAHVTEEAKSEEDRRRIELEKADREQHKGLPGSGAKYRDAVRAFEAAERNYMSLLEKVNLSELAENPEREAEHLKVLQTASLPAAPNFPNRWLFAAIGASTGLLIWTGLMVGYWILRTLASGRIKPLTSES